MSTSEAIISVFLICVVLFGLSTLCIFTFCAIFFKKTKKNIKWNKKK